MCVIMKFLVKLGDGVGNILKKLHTVYGDGALKVGMSKIDNIPD